MAVRWSAKRHNDVSYQDPSRKLGTGLDNSTSYPGLTFAGSGEPATELRGAGKFESSRGRSETVAEDDRAALLRNQGHVGRMPSASPYRTYSNDEYAQGDDSHMYGERPPMPPPRHPPGTAVTSSAYKEYDMKPEGYDDERSSDETDGTSHPYHPCYGPATSGPAAGGAGAGAQGISGGVHPVFRRSAEQPAQWDMFGGARGRTEDDRPPPGYWPDERH